MRLAADIETNGLTPDKVWCIATEDIDTGTVRTFDMWHIEEGLEHLKQASLLIMHNGVGFDLHQLHKLYGFEFDLDKVYDTAIMSRLLRTDRGLHKLEAWGERVGIAKLPDLDWNVWDKGLIDRCVTDVAITVAVYKQLKREEGTHDWKFAQWIEQHIAYYHAIQEENGVHFDVAQAKALSDHLYEELDGVVDALKSKMPCIIKANPNPTKPYNVDGSRPVAVKRWYGDDVDTVGGMYTKVVISEPKPSSDKQLKAFLFSLGWVPDEFNYVKDASGKPIRPLKISSPKLSDSSLEPLGDVGKLVKRRGMLQHRASMLLNRNDSTKGLLNNVRPDGRVVAGGIPMGTPTGRYTHSGVVNIPKANDPTKEYGTELRALFCAADGCILAGSDADGLEARMEGHYTTPFDKGVYAKTLIHGTQENGDDVHTRNALIWKVSRSVAKNGKYCLSYGGQAAKLANTLGVAPKLGQTYFDAFWDGNDALKRLKAAVTSALKRGYLTGLDGRKLYIRSEHSALNMLFQSAGSITVKLATIYMNQALTEAGVRYKQVLHMHDEFLLEIEEGQDNEMIRSVISDCWKRAGTTLKLSVPITGDTQFGMSWGAVH